MIDVLSFIRMPVMQILIPAWLQVELFQRCFHGGFVEAVILGGFLTTYGQRPQLFDQNPCQGCREQAIPAAPRLCKFRVIFGAVF